jgi:hypothetical protein
MKVLQLSIVALFLISSAAWAQSSPRFADSASPGYGPYPAYSATGPGVSSRIVRNANDCAPDHADAVWDANSSLIGYSCDVLNEH